jgi:hypothetical protein
MCGGTCMLNCWLPLHTTLEYVSTGVSLSWKFLSSPFAVVLQHLDKNEKISNIFRYATKCIIEVYRRFGGK